MELSVEQMKTILDMYAVVRIEGQVTNEITELMCEVAFALDQVGVVVCDECFDFIEIPSIQNVVVLPGGDTSQFCDLCIKK